MYKWVVLIVTTATQTGISFIAMGIGALVPFLEQQLKLTNAQVGLTVSAVNVGMALTAMLFGQLVDRFGEKRVLVTGGIMSGLSVIATSFSSSFGILLLLLVFTGLWAASSTPAGSKAIMTWFPFSMRGFAIGFRQMGVAGGGALAALILPIIALHSNWRHALVVAGVSAVVISTIVWFVYREDAGVPQMPGNAKAPQPQSQQASKVKDILRNKSLWYASAGATAFVGAQFIVIGYTQLFLHVQAHVSLHWTAYFLVIAQLCGVAGRVLWGVISDRMFKGARKPVMLVIGAIMAAICLIMLTIGPGTPLWLAGVLFAGFGFSAIGWNGIWVTLISELVGKDQAGTAVGVGMTVLQMGVLVFPLLFGSLIDHFHSYSVSWIALFFIVLMGSVLIYLVKEKSSYRTE